VQPTEPVAVERQLVVLRDAPVLGLELGDDVVPAWWTSRAGTRERAGRSDRLAKVEGATVYFADEAGIRSDYRAGTTWEPVGRTSVTGLHD
jgi:hypothetical protein